MASTELIFISGKGGTGKSAVAAALAISRARSGQRILAIDMGQSLGLGAHLRSPELPYRPVEVRPGLHAISMDRAHALDEYLKLQLRVPQGAPTRQLAGALAVLADTAPGVREIISIGKPVYEQWRGEWDAVVVDAPSLGQFQSYLRAPTTISTIVPSGNVKAQSERLEATLLDPGITSVVIVANPAELPVRETAESLDVFSDETLCPPPTVVMNRMLDESGLSASDLAQLPAGSVSDAATMQVALEGEQRTWSDAIEWSVRLPYLRGVLTPGEVAEQLADALGDRMDERAGGAA
ncbi:MAG: ArsA-related P-loop ATPase [Acidimicrobiia bacterium]|nr:ArsA-related P-loop ATPase [Acidimicrobiia bacterium]